MNFGKNLKAKRLERGITREELAGRVSSTHQSIWRYEKGLKYPDALMAWKLAKSLQVPISELFGEKGEAATPEFVLASIRQLVSSGELTLEDVVIAALAPASKKLRGKKSSQSR